jgi:hypothetical protein
LFWTVGLGARAGIEPPAGPEDGSLQASMLASIAAGKIFEHFMVFQFG